MTIMVTPSEQAFGAQITGVDLTQPLGSDAVEQIRAAWLKHHVVAFPDQQMNDDDLERFTRYFGPFGDDPFIAPIAGRTHVIAVERRADEQAPLFAENWHTDWSFQATPPSGTCLLGLTIPPSGGDTLYADGHLALRDMPAELRAKCEGKNAIHSARAAYSP
ncbi:MAG: TauD/TfdA family dioxygenase, partial [Halieaceae bacterium]